MNCPSFLNMAVAFTPFYLAAFAGGMLFARHLIIKNPGQCGLAHNAIAKAEGH